MWEIEITDQFEAWWDALTHEQQKSVATTVDALEAKGPTLGRPYVDHIKASRHHNMKELRAPGGHLRVLFAFDPRQTAVLLLGGDKTGQFTKWYATAIAEADELYDEHLREIENEEPPHPPSR